MDYTEVYSEEMLFDEKIELRLFFPFKVYLRTLGDTFIANLKFGDDDMAVLPGSTKYIDYEVRDTANNALRDADGVSITVYDASGIQRVRYTSVNLVRMSFGIYRYFFTIPTIVIPGNWKVEVIATIGGLTSNRQLNFEVRES